MKTICFILILVLFNTFTKAQIKSDSLHTRKVINKEKTFSFSIDFGGNYFLEDKGFDKKNNFTLNAMSFNASWLFDNIELGLVLGKSDIAEVKSNLFYVPHPFDTLLISNSLEPSPIYWYGVDIKYNFIWNFDFYTGMKICKVDRSGAYYYEFFAGKYLKLSDYLFTRFTINFSMYDNFYQLGAMIGINFRL